MLDKCSATYGVWSAIKVQLTVYICKNSMLEKYIYVGKPILDFVYHFYLKRTVFERTKFFNRQNFIKKSARLAGTFSLRASRAARFARKFQRA